ncbi:adenosylcobyric acid synthase [Chelatococcus caeni]|uniref:Cobyric acid synthase n=1 Tax=Chelatococcus caeni TaxID=1348468 RepID=A0A840BVJ6_9HYPH|nr:cobyric acid synthase [Chelatococcus caeni]MBB4017004.1 adenosylcobyric acid synthase [Chelatococcus caeni]
MATPAVMLQGTGSNVGKSLIVAGLCRLFARRGLTVRPFKAQNMSNNAAAVAGGEIGRAQALQARAARAEPTVHMNPVLLKPESDRGAQLIVQGRRHGHLDARDFTGRRKALMPFVLGSFAKVCEGADLVIVEGAGSPAEINLRAGDIANMGFATEAGVPVVLVGDIDRGGVIASLVGTHAVLDEADRAMVRGFLVNKFRGDPALFAAGMTAIAERTGWQPLGLLPWLPEASRLPAEDALDLTGTGRKPGDTFIVAAPVLPRIANFDDLDPLRLEEGVSLVLVPPGRPIPSDADLIVLPGSKATIADLAHLRDEGWDIDILAHVRRGRPVVGLCGGYQMLGRTIADPEGIEGAAGIVPGLGLLDIDTILTGDKAVQPVEAVHAGTGYAVTAYEIHLGRSEGPDCVRAPFRVAGEREGAMSPDGLVMGTYLHGMFAADDFRRAFLAQASGGTFRASLAYERSIEEALDRLAAHVGRHMDVDALLAIAKERGGGQARDL